MRGQGPVFYGPGVRCDRQPVDSGIGDGEVARFFQTDSRGVAIGDVEDPSVGDKDQRLSGVPVDQLLQGVHHTLLELSQAFAARQLVVRIACAQGLTIFRTLGDKFVACQSFATAEMPFAQIGVKNNRLAQCGSDRGGSLSCPLQVAAIEYVGG